MKKIIIRTATSEDVPAILEIIKLGFTRYAVLANATAASPALSETAEDVLCDLKEKLVLLAVSGDDVVGTLRVSALNDVAYVSRFAVKTEGCGIGTDLLNAAALHAQNAGLSLLTLHTAASAKSTISFYEKLGFSTLSEDMSRGYRRLYMGKQI